MEFKELAVQDGHVYLGVKGPMIQGQQEPQLLESIRTYAANPEIKSIILDLSRVSSVDKIAVGTLIRTYSYLSQAGKDLVVLSPSKRLDELMSASKFSTFFDVVLSKTALAAREGYAFAPKVPFYFDETHSICDVVKQSGDVLAVALTGSVQNIITENLLRDKIRVYFDTYNPRHLALDCSLANYINSECLGIMLATCNRLKTDGSFAVVGPNSQLEDLLTISKLTSVFNASPTYGELAKSNPAYVDLAQQPLAKADNNFPRLIRTNQSSKKSRG